MVRLPVEWNPSWDDDWQTQQDILDEAIEEDHPREPVSAVEFYRYGYATGRKQPMQEWPEVERDLYQDYMTGVSETIESESTEFREGIVWAHRGWEAGRK